MAIRFKFRSSVAFDSIDIGGQSSISVRDLRSKIIHRKNLACQDFGLILSDALTGQDYSDDNVQLPNGSNVIVKRVPAGSAPLAKEAINTVQIFGPKDSGPVKTIVPTPMNADDDNFDDFGTDLCPAAEVISHDSVRNTVNGSTFADADTTTIRFRCCEQPFLRWEKLEASGLSNAVPEGQTQSKMEGEASQTKLESKVEENLRLEQELNCKAPETQSNDLTSELRCSLCKNFFEEAVMIPCCQHSFCKKCIHVVLAEKQRCPKCFSRKCRPEDLLPNLSLRQAIEHFRESQILKGDPGDAFLRYVPDGESGIQAREFSSAVTVHQGQLNMPCSSSASRRRSHQADAAFLSDDFQGENQPLDLPLHDEADSTAKKVKGSWLHASGGKRSFEANDGLRKGYRTCYTCGSPDHLMRDCPAALVTFSGAGPGYMPNYWNEAPLPHIRPFQHIYGNPGMLAFNSTMVPSPPFAVPAYFPSMYGGILVPEGTMRIGMAPSGQDWGKRSDLLNENLRREHCSDDDDFHKQYEPRRSHFYKSPIERKKASHDTEDSHTYRSKRKRFQDDHSDDDINHVEERLEKTSRPSVGRDFRTCLPGSLEVEDTQCSSSWDSEDSHRYHSRSSKGKHRTHNGSDYNQDLRNEAHKGGKKRTNKSSSKRHHQGSHGHSESGSDPNFSCKQKETEYSHNSSRHSRHNKYLSNHELSRDSWKMRGGSGEDRRQDCHCQKRKRVH